MQAMANGHCVTARSVVLLLLNLHGCVLHRMYSRIQPAQDVIKNERSCSLLMCKLPLPRLHHLLTKRGSLQHCQLCPALVASLSVCLTDGGCNVPAGTRLRLDRMNQETTAKRQTEAVRKLRTLQPGSDSFLRVQGIFVQHPNMLSMAAHTPPWVMYAHMMHMRVHT
jgi:hypothetical protein